MEFHDGFGTVSTLHCDLFGPPVVFNILLQYKRHATPLKSPNDKREEKKINSITIPQPTVVHLLTGDLRETSWCS